MTTVPMTPDAAPRAATNPLAMRLATAFGLGYAPVAPGTAGSLVAVVFFVPILFRGESVFAQSAYLFVLVALALVGLWSVEKALPHWGSADPQPIVIDEVLGQWLTYGSLVLAQVLNPAAGAGWKYLLVGFILFRALDVMKPFPIRRSERLPGAAGVLLDDVLAGVYAGLGLLPVVRSGWLA
jgi:phosphatidylglycerophosphatase A